MQAVLSYIDTHRDRFVKELAEWVKIPAVSSDPAHKADMVKNAEHLMGELERLSADRVELWPTKGHPAVFAEWKQAPGKPTLLVYGHHDVQPVDPLNEWISPPFEPAIRDGRMWGRGVVDDKGQVHIHVKAIEAFIKARGKLPINLKLIVEGEEEIGSENLDGLMRARATDLAADFVCVSDTAMFGRGIPSLCVGLRGLAYLQVRVDGPSVDLHSGSFGGGVANPVIALAKMIARAHRRRRAHRCAWLLRQGRRAHGGRAQRRSRRSRSTSTSGSSRRARRAAFGEKGYSTLERVWARPTLDCNGIWGGFQGEGAKTIIPARALAKISCRLVPHQEPEEIQAKVGEYLKKIAPPGVKVTVEYLHGGRPYLAPTDHPVFEVAKRAFAKAFGRPTVFIREGGSIPFVRTIADATGKPCLLMGFGQPDENAHAPNEWLDLENYHLGIKSAAYLYDELSRLA